MTNDLIFFSYSRSDSEFALELAKKLQETGANIWIDQLDIKPSMHWDNTIEEALASSNRLVVILSKNSVASENVKDEYSHAIEKGKQVVPVLLEDCEVPFRLTRLQYADFTLDPDDGMKTLVETLKIAPAKDIQKKGVKLQAPITPGQKAIKSAKSKSKLAYVLLGAVVLLAILVGVFWNSLFPTSGPGSITVQVKGATEIEQSSLPEKGEVLVEVQGVTRTGQINNLGEVTFKELPGDWFEVGSYAKITFSDPGNEPYRVSNPDSTYQLNREATIPVVVKLDGLDKVMGIVKDFNSGDPVEGVRISVNGIEAFTNSYGEFDLKIPPEKQKKFQTLRAMKDGYQMYELSDIPMQTSNEIPILLKQKSS